MNFEFRCEKNIFPPLINLYGFKRENNSIFEIKPISIEKVKEGSYSIPFVSMEIKEAQRLMDELWDCGIRPSEGSGSAGSLKATQNHLEDMRKIVSKMLAIKEIK